MTKRENNLKSPTYLAIFVRKFDSDPDPGGQNDRIRIQKVKMEGSGSTKLQCDAIRWEQFCRDVVLDSVHMAYRDEDNILDQIYNII